MSLYSKARSLLQYHSKIGRWSDIQRFREWKRSRSRGAPITLRVRAAGGAPLYGRPGTSDPMVFWDTFWEQYHLPPRKLPRNAIILDLGANVGYTSAHLAALYPDARIVAVEMDGENAALAERNLSGFGARCRVIHAAVWSHDGELQYSGDHEWAYRIEAAPSAQAPKARAVRAVSIPTLLKECALPRVDFLKMDIEGAELRVFDHDLAWTKSVQCMTLEVHAPATPDWCRQQLTAEGFMCRPHPRHRHGVFAERGP